MKKTFFTILTLFLSSFLFAQNQTINDVFKIFGKNDKVVITDMREGGESWSWPYPLNETYIVGYFEGNITIPSGAWSPSKTLKSKGGKDGFVMLILYDENILNPKTIMQISTVQIGGIGDDIVYDIDEIFTQNSLEKKRETVICGSFENSCTFYNDTISNTNNITLTSNGMKDMFYANLLLSQDFVNYPFYSAQSFGGAYNDEAFSVSRRSEEIALTGYFEDNLNLNGTLPYCNKTLTSNGQKDIALIMCKRPYYNSTIVLQNPNQNAWGYSFGAANDDVGTSLMYTNNPNLAANLMITGYFENSSVNFNLPGQNISLSNSGGKDIFFGEIPINFPALTPCNSIHMWSYLYKIGGTGNDISTKIFNQENYILLSGSFQNSVNFRFPISNQYFQTSIGSDDGFIVGYQRNKQWTYSGGTFNPSTIRFWQDCYKIGGNGNDIVNDISTDYSDVKRLSGVSKLINTIAICGNFENTVNLSKNSNIPATAPLTSNGSKDMFFIGFTLPATNSQLQNILCTKTIGGIGEEIGKCVTVDDERFKLGGSFNNSLTINGTSYPSSGNPDGLYISFKSCTALNTPYHIGGAGYESASSIISEVSGNFNKYLAGSYFGSTSIPLVGGGTFSTPSISSSSDGIIMKINNSFGVEWVSVIGGIGDDYCTSITENGNFIYVGGQFNNSITIGGTTYSPCGGGTNNFDCFLACFNKSNGTLQWFKQFGGANGESIKKIIVDNNSNIYISGNFGSQPFYFNNCSTNTISCSGSGFFPDFFIAKLNSNGTLLWSTKVGGTDVDQVYDLIYNKNQNAIYISGWYNGTVTFGTNSGATTLVSTPNSTSAFIAKYDPSNGDNIWAKSADVGTTFGSIFYYTLYEDNSGNTVCIGTVFGQNISLSGGSSTLLGHPTNSTGNSTILVKYDLNGTILGAKQISTGINGNSDYIINQKAIINNNGEVFVTGFAEGYIDFNNNLTISAINGGSDLIGYKLNSNWDVVCVNAVGGTNPDEGTGLFLINNGTQAVICGTISGVLRFGNTILDLNALSKYYQIGLINLNCCD